MTIISRQVDQWVVIGSDLLVGPTDIDAKTVRLLAKGHWIGGPQDGEVFQAAHELSKGQSVQLGPMIVVTVVDILGQRVRLGVLAPAHLSVGRKEEVEQQRKGAAGGEE
jgi:sRNA-binding carbon storage regulator CsrA